jgi:hypothetical protein
MEITPLRESLCEKTYCAVTHQEGIVHKYLTFPMRCKSWDCPKCRKIKTEEYRKRMDAFQELPNLYFYTLTYDHSASLADTWATYNSAWNRLRTALAKRYGKFNYVRVLEPHKDPCYPHVHVIADKYFEPSYFGPEAVSAGFGWQLDSKKIDGPEALSYIVKYLSKEWPSQEAVALRKQYRCRIITFSRGLLAPINRVGGWKMLCRGSEFGACLDHILVNYTWQTEGDPRVVYERTEDTWYEVHIIFDATPMPGHSNAQELFDDYDRVHRQQE